MVGRLAGDMLLFTMMKGILILLIEKNILQVCQCLIMTLIKYIIQFQATSKEMDFVLKMAYFHFVILIIIFKGIDYIKKKVFSGLTLSPFLISYAIAFIFQLLIIPNMSMDMQIIFMW